MTLSSAALQSLTWGGAPCGNTPTVVYDAPVDFQRFFLKLNQMVNQYVGQPIETMMQKGEFRMAASDFLHIQKQYTISLAACNAGHPIVAKAPDINAEIVGFKLYPAQKGFVGNVGPYVDLFLTVKSTDAEGKEIIIDTVLTSVKKFEPKGSPVKDELVDALTA